MKRTKVTLTTEDGATVSWWEDEFQKLQSKLAPFLRQKHTLHKQVENSEDITQDVKVTNG